MAPATLEAREASTEDDLHAAKNAQAPAPVLVDHLSAALGLALRDLGTCVYSTA